MRKIIAFLISLFVTLQVFAIDFTVTSNADSGPGTLRQALIDAAANGTATQDRIIFNIADQSETGRTVTLLSQLPNVSSNLLIDGTTQPGLKFGIKSAFIKITYANGLEINAMLNIFKEKDIEILGLWLKGNWKSSDDILRLNGINIDNSNNIKIGAAGKGNIMGAFYASVSALNSTNIILKGNMAGLAPDGLTPDLCYTATLFNQCSNIVLGGTSKSEGNVFSDYGHSEITIQYTSNVDVENNFIGTDYTGNNVIGTAYNGVNGYGIVTTEGGGFIIKNNTIAGEGVGISLNYTETDYIISGNHIGLGATVNNNLQNYTAVLIYQAKIKGTVSQNVIGNNAFGLRIVNSVPVLVSQNSFFCNAGYAIKIENSLGSLPFVNITNKSANFIGGTSTSNAVIELFYTDECNLCQGKTYFATIQADNTGVWSFTGPISGNVVATATNNDGNTSGFSTPEIIFDSSASIKNATCGANGSITGITYRNATNITWTDIAGNIVSINKDLTQAPPGKYLVKIDNGTCSAVSEIYEIKNDPLKIIANNINITNATCGLANASITGITLSGAAGATIVWKDKLGNVAGNTLDLVNVKDGIYTLYIGINNTACAETYGPVSITNNNGPAIDQSVPVIIPANCGDSKGSITGITATGTGTIKYSWKNAQNQVVGTTKDLLNQPAGMYILQVTDDTNCGPAYSSSIAITNGTGPHIDQSHLNIAGANCGESTGSITGVSATGTGTIRYAWKNAQGQVVSNAADLLNQLPGDYTLLVTDDTNCGAVYSSAITIPTLNGVTMDEGGAAASPVTCGGNGDNYGRITGIKVGGATALTEYWWYDEKDVYVGKTRDPYFTTLKPGKYYMRAKNGTCLSTPTKQYTIAQQSNTADYSRYLTPDITKATCANNDGAISIAIGAPASADAKTYRWVAKLSGQTIGSNSNKITGLDAGDYQLYISDNNNCEKFVKEFTVDRVAGLTVATDRLQLRDDNCNQGLGRITGLKVTEVPGKPATCKWTDALGTVVGTTLDLLNRHAGTYTLNVTDGTICGQTLVYNIGNTSTTLTAPAITDVQLCTAGDALLNVSGVTTGYNYRLYDDLNSATPIDAQPSGKFKITVTGNRSYYVSQFVGDCESARAEVKVILGGLSALKLPNAISPNGDGINDTWKLPGIESYPAANVQVYTRAGQKVFDSTGYATPFNGVYNGKTLAAGTYYYIINLNTGCSLLSGSLTIIR